jgi:hypothetical protein
MIVQFLVHIGQVLSSVSDAISASYGVILTVGGILWVLVAKFVPNGAAGPFVQKLQTGLDHVAEVADGVGQAVSAICAGVGKLCHTVSQLLGDIVKSDGLLGRK